MSKKYKRIIMYIDEKPITASGVILYKFDKNKLKLLLIKSKNRKTYEDLGGHIDETDKDIYDTASREVFEESNKVLNRKSIKKRIKKSSCFYTPKSKYLIFLLEATDEEEKMNSIIFGDKEEHDDIERVIDWIPLEKFLKKETIKTGMNWRLKNRELFIKLIELQTNHK